jgi:hypothetical protein
MNSLAIGAILIEQSTVLPESPGFERAPYLDGWNVITNFDGLHAEEAIASAGWTFLFRAGEVVATAFGRNESEMMHAALQRVIHGKRPVSYNCLEITSVRLQTAFGRPRLSVGVHWRQIQESVFPPATSKSAIRNTNY